MNLYDPSSPTDPERYSQSPASWGNSAPFTDAHATADGDLRVIALRAFDLASSTLQFHTDARSPKIAAIKDDPSITVLSYDPEAKVQIRARGIGRVDTNGAAVDAAWDQAAPFAKRCYLAQSAPGGSCDSPISGLPDWVEGNTPIEAQVAPGRENFAVLLVRIEAFDWLYLANTGHRRARFEFSDEGMIGNWLVP